MLSRAHSPLGPLPEGWCVKYLSEIASKIGSGSTPRGGESAYISQRENFAFVRSQQVYDFYFEKNDLRFITDNDAEKLKGVHLKENDLLLNITGDGVTFSRCCIVPKEILPAAVNQHVSVIRLDQEKCLPGYLLSYLCHPKIKEYIASFNAGGSRRAITKQHIESFEIPLPPLYVQEVIQRVAFGLLSKIQLNQKINQTLEKMAQAIFKSWFVDFEPVKAKIAARQRWQALQPESDPASPVCYAAEMEDQSVVGDLDTYMNRAAMQTISGKTKEQLDALLEEAPELYNELFETSALFPSVIQESELGELPQGWNIVPIEQLCDVRKGLSYKGKHVIDDDSELPMINLGNFAGAGSFKAEKLKYYNGDYKKRHMVSAGQLMVANTDMTQNRIVLGSPIIVPHFSNDRVLFTHHTFAVDFKEEYPESTWRNFIYFWCLQPSFRSRAGGFATGTTVLALPKDAFLKSEIIISPDKVVHAFNKIINGFFSQQEVLARQNSKLTEMRDILLPKLLSSKASFFHGGAS